MLALLLSLLTVGRLSDFVGRRPVLAAALVLDAAAMAVFLGADGVGWLVVARIVQGLATGAGVGVLGAYLLDLQPADGSRLGSLVNSAAPTTGLGVGAVVTGVLVQWAPHPTRLVFVILTALFVLLALATLVLPETVRARARSRGRAEAAGRHPAGRPPRLPRRDADDARHLGPRRADALGRRFAARGRVRADEPRGDRGGARRCSRPPARSRPCWPPTWRRRG